MSRRVDIESHRAYLFLVQCLYEYTVHFLDAALSILSFSPRPVSDNGAGDANVFLLCVSLDGCARIAHGRLAKTGLIMCVSQGLRQRVRFPDPEQKETKGGRSLE